jgi:hypothetical protein
MLISELIPLGKIHAYYLEVLITIKSIYIFYNSILYYLFHIVFQTSIK